MKTDQEIKQAISKAQALVQDVYKDDERLKQDPRPDGGVARETDIVFRAVLEHLLA